ncbi:MAG TPA: hypothetical protein VK172_00615 [Lentimicrobium sp.]|nr:hypothetical protein [Lentimicrobium sp.]
MNHLVSAVSIAIVLSISTNALAQEHFKLPSAVPNGRCYSEAVAH